MRIVDLLKEDSIQLNAAPQSKAEAIDMLVALQVKGGRITDPEAYKKGILAREAMSSTAVGEGIAIPHAKSEAVAAPSLAAMTVPQGVDYEAMDDEPSDLLFMIAAPNDGDVHLEVLSRLMTLLMDEDFRAKLIQAPDKKAFLQAIDDAEREKYPDEPKAEPAAPALPTPTWRQKHWKKPERKWGFPLKWKPTAPAAPKIFSPRKRSKPVTALLLPQTRR